ncbi:MAG: Nif3-like dinuclear metal center hexameric protein, partial [Acidobacteriaceae bacterium]|nr:Nif3-like dinuclear metal center hexameric protein [Acidobacteriaceae bacterium]
DTTTALEQDPIYRFKQDFIRRNNMIVWRFHDHLHARKPDAVFAGFTRMLGWQQYEMADTPTSFNIPPRRFADLAREVQTKLKTRSMRVIGDSEMMVSKIGRGSHDLGNHIRNFQRFDVLISGEVREWDTVEYVRDLVLSGQKKGLLLIAHERWEEHGMKECADWLRTFISEVPIEFVPSGEPFWIPGVSI